MGALQDLGRDVLDRRDPVRLARRAGIDPDPWQVEVMRSHAPRMLINAARQTGKSTTIATVVAWTALFKPGALILIFGPAERQSRELFTKAREILTAQGQKAIEAQLAAESALQLRLGNGSRIVSLPDVERNVRGFSKPALVVIDEAAFTSDELYGAVLPMLSASPDGRLIAMSTPNGRRGWWYRAWQRKTGWQTVFMPATQAPRVVPGTLEEARRELPDWKFRAEFLCEFVDTDAQVFPSQLVAQAFTDAAPLFPDLEVGEWQPDRLSVLADVPPLFEVVA